MREYFLRELSVLAIDPGLSGAVAKVGRGKLEVRRDFKTIRNIACAVLDLHEGADCAVIEAVHAMPGQGVVSTFSFGRSTGTAYGALHALGSLPLREVTPQHWQGFMREKFDLNREQHPVFDSRALALRLFPEHADLFKRVKDHNTSDAILMGLWRLAQPD